MFRELAAHSLTANTTIVSKHMKGDSGKLTIWADKISRNSYTPIDGGAKGPGLGRPNFRHTNIRGKSVGKLKVAISIKDRKLLNKSLPSKGVGRFPKLKIKKTDKDPRGSEVSIREMGICLEAQLGVGQCLLKEIAIWWIATPEVLISLGRNLASLNF